MNPQTSPWTILADRQRYNDFKRQQQEKQLKNYIRLNYQKQLTEQLNQQKEMKLKEKQKEKQWEKNLINSSIENQQRIIEMEKMKNYAANQKQSRLDYENQYLKAARKQRQDFLEGQTKKVQNQMHKIAEQKLRKQQMQEDLKKKMVLETLKESMDTKKAIQRYKKEQQQQFQSHKLQEGDMLHQREQQYREDYLRKLKEKAATIDYGSHEAFTKNHYKTLVQRKKQEWQSEQQYRRRAEQLNSYEEQYKKLKQGVEDGYRSQLKKQMNQREYNRKQSHRREISNDLDNMMRYQTINKSVDLHKKEIEDRHKKQLLDYLKKQVDYKNNLPKQPYFMRDNEILLNYNLLQNSKGIIPGETYELDHARKKQLQTVAKSIVNSPKLDSNYLAGRGKTILN